MSVEQLQANLTKALENSHAECARRDEIIARLRAEIRTLRGFISNARDALNLAMADYPGNAFEDIPEREIIK